MIIPLGLQGERKGGGGDGGGYSEGRREKTKRTEDLKMSVPGQRLIIKIVTCRQHCMICSVIEIATWTFITLEILKAFRYLLFWHFIDK